MEAVYHVTTRSVIGTREEQQDSVFQKVENQNMMAIVCDGMGGLESGKIASMAATEKFKELYERKNPSEGFPSFLLKAVDILDEFVFQLKNKNGERLGAGTTFTAVVIEKNKLFWLSVGDSRLYILRDNELVRVTRDHNYFLRLDQMMREKEISESEYQTEAVKGETLISFIGMGGVEVMDLSNAPFQLLPKDTLLLMTDGLYKALSDEEIKECLNMTDIEKAATALINRANEKAQKFQDNTTYAIIRYKE